MHLNDIRQASPIQLKKILAEQPDKDKVPSKSALVQNFKKVANQVNQIASKYNSSAKINSRGDAVHVLPATSRLVAKTCNETVTELNATREQVVSIESGLAKNRAFVEKLKGVSSGRVRLKAGNFKPCYDSFTHLRKSLFSSSYKTTLVTTKESYGSLKKVNILSQLEKKISSGEKEKEELENKLAKIRSSLEEINKDSATLAEAYRFFEHSAAGLKSAEKLNKKTAAVASEVQRKRFDKYQLMTFFNIYSTNSGSRAINTSLSEGKALSLNAKEIVRELERRSGDDIFTRGGRKERDAIYAFCRLTRQDILSLSKEVYDDKISKISHRKKTSENNKEGKSYFRGQNVSDNFLENLQEAFSKGALYQHSCLMSVSTSDKAASDFIRGNNNKLFVKIKGSAAIPAGSSHTVNSEEESVFTPYSLFEIVAFGYSRKNDRYELELVEKMPWQVQGREVVSFPRY